MLKETDNERDDRKPLPPRLVRVIDLLSSGLTQTRIAAALELSPHTVRGYVRDIYRRFGVNGRLQLIALLRVRRIEQERSRPSSSHDRTRPRRGSADQFSYR